MRQAFFVAAGRNLIALIVLLVITGIFGAATAQTSGPHFLAEGNLGLSYALSESESRELGSSGGLILGVGGRPAGSWLRYYAIAELSTAGYSRLHVQNFRAIELDRRLYEFGLAGRVVAPLTAHIRLFADLGIMGIRSRTHFLGDHLAAEESAQLGLGLRLATGLQVRPVERFSLGLRFAVTAPFDGFEDEVTGWLVGFDSEMGHGEATLQLSVYF